MSSVIAREQTVLPPKLPLEGLSALMQQPGAALVAPNGDQLELPVEVFNVLRAVVLAMEAGQAVTVAPVHQRLTTQEAADLIGVTRPTFVKYLEQGRIPYDQPGRHRRVLLADVLAFKKERSSQRREALDEMVAIADEAGMYDEDDFPTKTR